ncbi:ester hydrolase C11orf54 homolog [Formica exsecta]|uniref:ester hydrolase C11orf54 homolog n=1 Tax=Formica exsecta TaxID=72781 RepID=UPI001143FBED|nr:ester hydrolase C11orf54 homolog [Formica exsecta]
MMSLEEIIFSKMKMILYRIMMPLEDIIISKVKILYRTVMPLQEIGDILRICYYVIVLYISLQQFFDEFEIAVVSCPCLSRPPYDFAAVGLSGNTGILQMGDINNIIPIPQTDLIFDIQSILSSYCYDFFVIGSGFAAKPLMPYNGYLIINAIISANFTNVINNSCIVYEDANTGQRISQIINDPNQIKCSMLGNFYFSEGRRGMV